MGQAQLQQREMEQVQLQQEGAEELGAPWRRGGRVQQGQGGRYWVTGFEQQLSGAVWSYQRPMMGLVANGWFCWCHLACVPQHCGRVTEPIVGNRDLSVYAAETPAVVQQPSSSLPLKFTPLPDLSGLHYKYSSAGWLTPI